MTLFTPEDEKEIVEAIKNAETMSTGEIRVHLDNSLKGDPLAKAQAVFAHLGMQNTQERNGVLFFISESDRQIAVIGDENIHQHVKQTFWNNLSQEITASFKEGKFKDGLVSAILKTGHQLKKYFPASGQNLNELPNEISR
ncbi:MAG: DUF5130 family protein [Flavobacteriaceae bacterium]|jgi:uncharacterized membrane protein|nr:DUF5130 family protein [Flavobacteriaceae bacterium]